jgi:hypothetical protein
VSSVSRAVHGARTVVGDPVGRRAYLARLKWLLRGSGALQAWSLEYRAGLAGRFAVEARRTHGDPQVVLDCPVDCGAHAPLAHLYEPRCVYRLDRTVTSTATGATLMCGTEEPPFFVRESITWPFESILSHGLEIPEVGQVAERVPGTAAVFPTSGNYYHWLIEDLPTVLRAAEAEPSATFVAFAEGMTDRHASLAAHLGIELRPAPLTVAIDRQVLAGRASDSWFVHPEDARRLAALGAELTGHDGSRGHERIYVSRRFSQRALPDEEQLERLLSAQGFTILHLESMEWRQQIRAFQDASVVVAPHGAGLSNLVFTPPGARLVELTNGYHYNRCFEWICHVVGHEYRAVDSDATPASADPQRLADAIAAHLAT